MSEYFTPPADIIAGVRARSAKINDVIQSIEDAFDTLPTALVALKAEIVTARSGEASLDDRINTAETSVTAQAAAAALSASNALTSENSASDSADAAFISESNAVTAKNAAEVAQTAAETAETNAETAETNAETAETGAIAAYDDTVAIYGSTVAVAAAVAAAETAQTAAELAETNAAASAATSEANANYKGEWGDQTGAAAIPYSVSNDGLNYQLILALADVTTVEPGVTAGWATYWKLISNREGNQIADASLGTGTHTFSYVAGDGQQLTATGDITLAISGFTSGKICYFVVDAVNFGAHTITHPAAWLFAAGTAPTYTSAGTDRIVLRQDKDDVVTLHVSDQDIKAV